MLALAICHVKIPTEIKPPLKFIYSEATKFCEISTLLLSYVVPVKSKVEILQTFVAFSEYMNFNITFFYIYYLSKILDVIKPLIYC